MYLDYFGLKKQPFGITPDTSLFFKGADRGDVLEAVIYALNSGQGIIKVVGEVGSGKTMLSRMLVNKMPDETVFVYLLNPSISAEQVLYAIAYDLGLKVDPNDQSIQILHVLQQKLLALYQQGKKVVLVIDEAQQMPLGTLEEIRLLSNLETETEKLLQILLFGQPELDEHIDSPSVRQLRERITYSFYLSPLDWHMTDKYLHFRLAKAGHTGRGIFSMGAIKLLTNYANGTLRRLNVMADKALLAAYLDKSPVVDTKHIRLAMKDNVKSDVKKITPQFVLFSLLVLAIIVSAGYGFLQNKKQLLNIALGNSVMSDEREQIKTVPVLPRQVGQEKKQLLGLLDRREKAYEEWRAKTQKKYTLQVFSVKSDEEGVITNQYLEGIKNKIDMNQVFVRQYRTSDLGYITYFGSFETHSEAFKAIAGLPTAMQNAAPFITNIPKQEN